MGDPIAAQEAGVIYLPGDRHAEGLFLALTVRENMTALGAALALQSGFHVAAAAKRPLRSNRFSALGEDAVA